MTSGVFHREVARKLQTFVNDVPLTAFLYYELDSLPLAHICFKAWPANMFVPNT